MPCPVLDGSVGIQWSAAFLPLTALNNEIVLKVLKEKGTRNAKNQAGKNQGTLDEQAPARSQEHSPAAPKRLKWAQVLFC